MIFTNVDEYLEKSEADMLMQPQVPHGLGQLQVVATSGAFDILTPGHIRLFEYCRRLGTYVLVLLNTDESIREYKGKHRPVKPWKDRAEILDSLKHVEHVIGMPEPDPRAAISMLKPDVWVKGNRPIGEVVELEAALDNGEFVSVWTHFQQSSSSYIEKAAKIYLAETGQKMVSDAADRYREREGES